MGNPVVHFEIGAEDVARAREFYARLFDWQIDVGPSGYGAVRTGSGDGIGGGIMPTPDGRPAWVTFYVAVDDLEKHLALAEELGGRRIMGPTPIDGMGSFAIFADPDGNVLGLFTEPPVPAGGSDARRG